MKNIPPPNVPEVKDSKAAEENDVIQNGRYAEETLKNDHHRRERFKKHIGWGAIAILWLLIASILAMIFCCIYHFVIPEKFAFLSKEQLHTIQTIIFSSAATKLVPEILKKYF